MNLVLLVWHKFILAFAYPRTITRLYLLLLVLLHQKPGSSPSGLNIGQNPSNIIDKPIYYASPLMNNVEINYYAIEKKALTIIYALKKIRHYWLGNIFTIFVDHQVDSSINKSTMY